MKVRIRITEKFTGRTLALSNVLDETDAIKFVNNFYKYFNDNHIVDIVASIE